MFLRELELANQRTHSKITPEIEKPAAKGKVMDRVKEAKTVSKKRKIIQEWIANELATINKSEIEDF